MKDKLLSIAQDRTLASMYDGQWRFQVAVLGYKRQTVDALVRLGMLEITYLDHNRQVVSFDEFMRVWGKDAEGRKTYRLTAKALAYLARTGRVAA